MKASSRLLTLVAAAVLLPLSGCFASEGLEGPHESPLDLQQKGSELLEEMWRGAHAFIRPSRARLDLQRSLLSGLLNGASGVLGEAPELVEKLKQMVSGLLVYEEELLRLYERMEAIKARFEQQQEQQEFAALTEEEEQQLRQEMRALVAEYKATSKKQQDLVAVEVGPISEEEAAQLLDKPELLLQQQQAARAAAALLVPVQEEQRKL
ncbi:hypothetical protein Efla_002063 [Eimeria flavescens]